MENPVQKITRNHQAASNTQAHLTQFSQFPGVHVSTPPPLKPPGCHARAPNCAPGISDSISPMIHRPRRPVSVSLAMLTLLDPSTGVFVYQFQVNPPGKTACSGGFRVIPPSAEIVVWFVAHLWHCKPMKP
jgi:hypothetical protein